MDNTERFEYLGYMICRDPLTGKQWITDLNCWVADVTSHIEAKISLTAGIKRCSGLDKPIAFD